MPAHKWIPLLAAMVACTPASIARQASRAAVDQGAEELTREDTQESLQEAAEDPQVQAATRSMTEEIAEGVLQAFESERGHQQIASITRGITQAAVQQMVAALGADQTRQHLVGLTQGITDAALKQAASSLTTELSPALRSMLREDLTQGLASALQSKELQPAFGLTAKNVGYNLVAGANDGLGAAWQNEEGMLGEARGLPGAVSGISSAWLWLPLTAMALLTLMFVSGAVMLTARARQARAEVSRLESATLLLATAMREKQQTEQTDEIVALVQHALEGRVEKTGKHRILDALRIRKTG